MKIFFKVNTPTALSRATKNTDVVLLDIDTYEKVSYIPDVASWYGENYMASDVGISGELRIDRLNPNELNTHKYKFWIDTDLYDLNLLETSSKFLGWNHIRKAHIDSFLSIVIPEIRDRLLSQILE